MDILGALNTGGSGLNIKELSETLSRAETEPRKDLITDRIDSAEMSLSGYERLRGQMTSLTDAMDMMRNMSARALRSDNAAVGLTLNDASALDMKSANLDIRKLAQAQVLNFSGFTGPDQTIGAGSIQVDIGGWSDAQSPVFSANGTDAQTLTFAPTSTLADVANKLSSLDGVSARVIDLGDGTFSLGVISDTGSDNALRFSASGTGAIAAFDFASDPSTVQVQTAQNAELKLNGIDVTRGSNEIDDLLPGISLTLRATTTQPAALSVSADLEGTLAVMGGFVDMVNATRSLVGALTSRGTGPDGVKGDLAGDTLATDVMSGLSSILSRSFGKGGVHLADIGIMTQRDGTLQLDEAAFTKALTENPALLDPMIDGDLRADDITLSGNPPPTTAAGSFTFSRDPSTGLATLGGVPVFGRQDENGDWTYAITSGPLRGVTLNMADDVTKREIKFAPSMIDSVQGHLASVTASGNTLQERETALSNSIMKETEAVSALETRQEELRLRYLSKFTEMERVVTQLNSTADYLTNMVDAWNSNN